MTTEKRAELIKALKRLAFSFALPLLFLLPFLAIMVFGGDAAHAQSVTIDMGGDGGEGGFSGRVIQLLILMTILSLVPSILIMVTSFTRIIIVLSLLRSAIGVQQSPPNQVMLALALFLTFFIMSPTLTAAYQEGVVPLVNEEIDETQAFEKISAPFHLFMRTHVRDKDLLLFIDMSGIDSTDLQAEDVPLHVLIPAFMISELRRAFEIGFLVFIPFLIIDMVTASILMSMGMMMLPPVMIALPFKIIFFVLVDGWYMIAGSLVASYGISGFG